MLRSTGVACIIPVASRWQVVAEWFNRAFFQNIGLVLRPSLVLPDLSANSICDVDIDALRELGVSGCILDVNQTLVAYGRTDVTKEIVDGVKRLKSAFAICALSNYFNDQEPGAAHELSGKIETQLGIPLVHSLVKKPSSQAFEAARSVLQLPYSACAIGRAVVQEVPSRPARNGRVRDRATSGRPTGTKDLGMEPLVAFPLQWKRDQRLHS